MARPAKKKIAVVLATRNRSALLEKALDSLLEQTLAAKQFEVAVIDNASTDDTRAVFDRIEERFGDLSLSYHYESNLGISFGRNRGLAETKAPLLAFLDDDAVAERGWLEALIKGFKDEASRPLCLGGEIVLDWQEPEPGWLPRGAMGMLGRLSHGQTSRALSFPGEQLYGSNMCFERVFLEEIGGFDTRLGRKGNNLISNDETAVMRRLIAAGGSLVYEPSAVVHHWVPQERARLSWFLRRSYAQGVTDVIERQNRSLDRKASAANAVAEDMVESYEAQGASTSTRRRGRRRRQVWGTPRGVRQRLVRLGRRLRTLVERHNRESAVLVLLCLAHDAGSLRQNLSRRKRRENT